MVAVAHEIMQAEYNITGMFTVLVNFLLFLHWPSVAMWLHNIYLPCFVGVFSSFFLVTMIVSYRDGKVVENVKCNSYFSVDPFPLIGYLLKKKNHIIDLYHMYLMPVPLSLYDTMIRPPDPRVSVERLGLNLEPPSEEEAGDVPKKPLDPDCVKARGRLATQTFCNVK